MKLNISRNQQTENTMNAITNEKYYQKLKNVEILIKIRKTKRLFEIFIQTKWIKRSECNVCNVI